MGKKAVISQENPVNYGFYRNIIEVGGCSGFSMFDYQRISIANSLSGV
jgi:hypothetical protein